MTWRPREKPPHRSVFAQSCYFLGTQEQPYRTEWEPQRTSVPLRLVDLEWREQPWQQELPQIPP
jgi:hypothetical protein